MHFCFNFICNAVYGYCNLFSFLLIPYRNWLLQFKVYFVILTPANGVHKQISSMFDGSSPMYHRDKSKCGPIVRKKAQSPERTLLPLFSEKSFPTSSGSKDLFSFSSFTENLPSNKPELLWKPPHLIGHAGSQRAIAEAKWAEGLRPVTPALRADTPTGIAQLKAER